MMNACPRCGTAELEKKQIHFQVVNAKTMKPVGIRPAWEMLCQSCGWMDTWEEADRAQIA